MMHATNHAFFFVKYINIFLGQITKFFLYNFFIVDKNVKIAKS